ncbi:hypothetical protein BDZ97DRAFT_1912770 [Flammula alnicola]|nr:hypothetical protein BDZ97DRAFT_1912770 [Flammula alnicola]
MAKNAKKPIVHHGKPITAFFTRSSKAPPTSQDAPSSSAETGSLKKSSSHASITLNGFEPSENAVVTSKSPQSASKSPVKSVSTITSLSGTTVHSPRSSERGTTSQILVVPSASTASRKRSRSPDVLSSKRSSTPNHSGKLPGTLKSPERRKNKFDSDSEVEDFDAIIYVKSTPNLKRKKKARLSSPEATSLSEGAELVPSSQSDEEELPPTKMEQSHQKGIPNSGGKPNRSPEDEDEDVSMNVDEDFFADSSSPLPATLPAGKLLARQESQSSDLIMTPPPSDIVSEPPAPVALDQASKTAKIIAEIKARAYAKILSSPEVLPLEFNDQLDSSSDEEDFLPTLPNATMKTSHSTSDSLQKPFRVTTRRSSRNTSRNHAPSSSPTNGSSNRASSSRTLPRKSSSPGPKNRRAQGKKPITVDPFASLLKEKRLADKHGDGDDAFHRAEIATHNFRRHSLLDEMDEEDDDEISGWNDEDAVMLAAQDTRLFLGKLTTPDTNRSNSQGVNVNLGEETRKTLFGEQSGKAILDILEHDKAVKRQDELSEKVSGIHFWSTAQNAPDTTMLVDGVAFSYQIPGTSALVRLLNASLRRSDFSHAAMLLDMNFLSSVDEAERTSVASCLCDLAFSSSAHLAILSESAVRALEDFWGSSVQPLSSRVTFSKVLTVIIWLGAEQSIVSSQNWPVTTTPGRDASASRRERVIQRMLVLVNSCARSGRLPREETPDIVLALLLIGMDSTASPDLIQDIIRAVDLACRYISPEGSVSVQSEIILCSKVLKCVRSYEPINKARLVSLLSSGSGSARRIANFIAYCIVTGKESPELFQEIYSDAPPLPNVLEQLLLYSRSSSSPPGKFAVHDQTDYVDLEFYITILGVAVSNLRSYVTQERQTSRLRNSATRPESPSKNGEKVKTDLQLLHSALENLHSSISDTRATHLERSRTKASIKGLAMNIHYQRENWLRNDPDAKSKTLAQYFMKKAKA